MYKLQPIGVLRLDDMASIPPDDMNVDWVAYQQWLAAGNTPTPDTLQEKKASLKRAATAQRGLVETGGITLPNGTQIATAKDDQDRITSVLVNAQIAGIISVNFKSESGWVQMTIDDLKSVATAIALHVQACFNAEFDHHTAIGALTAETVGSYDVTAGWPS